MEQHERSLRREVGGSDLSLSRQWLRPLETHLTKPWRTCQ